MSASPFLLTFVVLTTLISIGRSANILSIFPVPSKSHDILGSVLSKHLAAIGHNVTYISAYSHKGTVGSFYPIRLEKMDELKENMKKYMRGNATAKEVIRPVLHSDELAIILFEDPDVKELIQSDSKFDAIIHFFGIDASLALAHRFDAPLIVFVPMGAMFPHNMLMANPAPPSYISTIITPYNENMTFLQRVANTVIPFVAFSLLNTYLNYVGNKAIETYLPGYPTIQEIIQQRADLILLNSHISTETARPYVPNMIQIGGFHLQKPEPLSEDLKKVLDDAKEGFVYFSFGTNVNVKELPKNVLDVFKTCLGKLPLKVIMKYEDDTMPNQPENFYLRKWFPQPSVLAHPNAKLFISHGGYGGTTESLYYGVPLVCIPFFGDQSQNCAEAEYNGYSVTVDLKTMNEKSFSGALQKVLYNETFKDAIKFKSELYRDQPMNPMDKAVYWIEHVIKHKGAKHLKVKGTQLPWYQYHLIDVFLFLGFVAFLMLSLCYYSCKFAYKIVCRKFCSRKTKAKTH